MTRILLLTAGLAVLYLGLYGLAASVELVESRW